jgi:large subunit ribosomal protein L9
MNVILRENVSNLGKIGDIVSVSQGYWRNYLNPRKLALLANSRNVNQLEHNKQVTQARLVKARAAAETVGEKLSKVTLSIAKRCGGDGRLFGSVTPRELVDLLSDEGIAIDRKDLSQ